MDFADQILQFSERVLNLKDSIQTEEATKTSLIMPFFSIMGYDVFNPNEFTPEFTADVGIKKGEKVDFAIIQDGEPMILIECKSVAEKLAKHDSQLFRYFGTTKAKFAILTNGVQYNFYTDLDEINKMDSSPFFSFNITDIKENQIAELKKFHKTNFNVDSIMDIAEELKYSAQFKQIFASELANPSDDFVKLMLTATYTGVKTQNVIEKFRPVIKKSLNSYISELMNDKIKNALSNDTDTIKIEKDDAEESVVDKKSKIVTTDKELEAFVVVKNILRECVEDINDITYKDTESYFGILYQNNTRKWICRLILTDNVQYLILPDECKNDIKYSITSAYDINNYKSELIEVLNRYVKVIQYK